MKKYLLQKPEKYVKYVCELTEKEYRGRTYRGEITVDKEYFKQIEIASQLEEGVEVWDGDPFLYSTDKTYVYYPYSDNIIALIRWEKEMFKGVYSDANDATSLEQSTTFTGFIEELKKKNINEFYEFETFTEFCEWYLKEVRE
jgi:hypothetical protein